MVTPCLKINLRQIPASISAEIIATQIAPFRQAQPGPAISGLGSRLQPPHGGAPVAVSGPTPYGGASMRWPTARRPVEPDVRPMAGPTWPGDVRATMARTWPGDCRATMAHL